MKYVRAAIMLFLLAAASAALAGTPTEAEIKGILEKASKLYDAKDYAKAATLYDKIADYVQTDTSNGELYDIACVYSLVGRKDRAIEVLKLAVAAGWNGAAHMVTDSDLDNIRQEPAFRQIMAGMIDGANQKAESTEATLATWRNPGTSKKLGGREFELVGVPADRISQQSREVVAITPFKGRVYIGYGKPFTPDTGLIITSFNPADKTWRCDFRIVDASRRRLRPIGQYLYVPGTLFDLDQHASYRNFRKFSSVYRLPGDGSYVRYRTIPDASVVWDIAGVGGELFVSTTDNPGDTMGLRNGIMRSADGGGNWESAYEFKPPAGQRVFCSYIVSFRNRLYAFRNSSRRGGRGVFLPNAFDGNEAVVYDGKGWTEADLIADKELISVGPACTFKDQLLMVGQYLKPGDDSTTLANMRCVLYAWNDEGNASRTFKTKGFDFQGWFSDDNALYVLDKAGQVFVTKDLKKFDLLLALPKDVSATAVASDAGFLYVACKNGEVYRTKL